MRTRDADLAFSSRARLPGDIGKALHDGGFHMELSADETPPIAQYHLAAEIAEDPGFFAEFLTPLTGGGTRRNGTSDATLLRSGISAQRLRHLDVLLLDPWEVALGGHEGIPPTPALRVRVANPTAFMAQKLLIHHARPPHKRAQDILYLHDTLQLFGSSWSTLASTWDERIRPALTRRQLSSLHEARQRIFASVSAAIREATRIPVDRHLRPDDLRMTCRLGLAVVFGGETS